MKICLPIISLAAFLWTPAARAQTEVNDFYRQWVDYRNGAVSLAFDQTPIRFAISALHATTGFQIVVPSVTEIKVVNLKLHQQPLEPAIRSLISSIGYKNFAMIYDEKGQANRAVVLGAQPQIDERTAVAKTESMTLPLSSDEREKLQKDLERWGDLKQEERGRIEDRLKNLPESDERDQLVKLYGKQILASTK
jgi:type II secretory pathway component GspD/PulD (secretin)